MKINDKQRKIQQMYREKKDLEKAYRKNTIGTVIFGIFWFVVLIIWFIRGDI